MVWHWTAECVALWKLIIPTVIHVIGMIFLEDVERKMRRDVIIRGMCTAAWSCKENECG